MSEEKHYMIEFAPADEVKSEARMSSEELGEIAEALLEIKNGKQESFRIIIDDPKFRKRMLGRIRRLARDKVQAEVTVRTTQTGIGVWSETPEETAARAERAKKLQASREKSGR